MAASVVIKPRREGTTRPPVWARRKAPVPKVHFAWPGATQPWPIKRGLLVARDTHDRDAVREIVETEGLPNSPELGRISGNIWGGTPNKLAEIVLPAEGPDVHEQGPRGVGRIGDEPSPVGEVPDQEAIDGSRGQLTGLGAGACPGDMVEDPGDLGRREIRVDHQAGPLADFGLPVFERGRRCRPSGGPARPGPGRSTCPCRGPRQSLFPVDSSARLKRAERRSHRLPASARDLRADRR